MPVQEAVAALEAEGLAPRFILADLARPETLAALRDHMQESYGGIDVLVNNAGIAFKQEATEPFAEQVA
jgi:carbonyl reductase 1